jgi:hypothetical protein
VVEYDRMFVSRPADVYGEAFSRDIEPSVDAGTRLYDIMASCIRLFRAGVRACTDALVKEACCAGAAYHTRHADGWGCTKQWRSSVRVCCCRLIRMHK